MFAFLQNCLLSKVNDLLPYESILFLCFNHNMWDMTAVKVAHCELEKQNCNCDEVSDDDGKVQALSRT